MSLGRYRRLARLERWRGLKPGPHLHPARLQRRLARLEAELARLEAEALALGAPDDKIMAFIGAMTSDGLAAEIETIRRALLTPRQRAADDDESRRLRQKYEAMTVEQLDAVINEMLAAKPRPIRVPIAPPGAPEPGQSQ